MMIPDCSISYLSSVRSCVATACSFQSSILLPLPLPLTGPPQSSQMSLRLRQRSAVHGPSAPRPIPPCFPTSWTSWSPLRDSQCWLRPLHRARVHHTAHRTAYHSLAQQLGKKKVALCMIWPLFTSPKKSVPRTWSAEQRVVCTANRVEIVLLHQLDVLICWVGKRKKKTPPFLFTALTLENHCKIEMLLIHLAAWYVKLSDVRKQTLTSAKSSAPKLRESSQATFIMDSLSTTWPFLGSCSCLLTPRIVSSPQFERKIAISAAATLAIYKLKLVEPRGSASKILRIL